jgi:hypothetical protein
MTSKGQGAGGKGKRNWRLEAKSRQQSASRQLNNNQMTIE